MTASSAAAQAALKSGEWTESVDTKTGKKYYVHKKTRKTVWDLDKELAATSAATAAAAKPTTTTSSSGPSPAAAQQPSPAAAVGAASPAGGGGKSPVVPDAVAAALQSGTWSEKVDPKSGKIYYVNKVTKATTWDLAKELGVTATASPTPAAPEKTGAATPAATATSSALPPDWVEKVDPKSGKTYYYNKVTKQTTWELSKIMPQSQPTGATATTGGDGGAPTAALAEASPLKQQVAAPAARPQPAAVVNPAYANPPPAKPKKHYTAAEALASGEWQSLKDVKGGTYYMHTPTGQTAMDLQLFLDIQRALDNSSDADMEQGWEQINGGRQMNDWMTLILRAPGHEDSADRLMAPFVQHKLTEAAAAVAAAREGEDAQRAKVAALEATVSDLHKSLEAHQREVHQLQCAVFYGIGGRAGGGNAASATSGLLKYVPAAADSVAVHATGSANAAAQRIEYLEKLLGTVQAHNVQLQEEISELRRRGHERSTCQHCGDNDPWRRVLDSAKGERPPLTSIRPTPTLQPGGFDEVAQRPPFSRGEVHHHTHTHPKTYGVERSSGPTSHLQQQQHYGLQGAGMQPAAAGHSQLAAASIAERELLFHVPRSIVVTNSGAATAHHHKSSIALPPGSVRESPMDRGAAGLNMSGSSGYYAVGTPPGRRLNF